jgi:hypothetical protein
MQTTHISWVSEASRVGWRVPLRDGKTRDFLFDPAALTGLPRALWDDGVLQQFCPPATAITAPSRRLGRRYGSHGGL